MATRAQNKGVLVMSRQYLAAGSIVGEVVDGKSFKACCAAKKSLGKVEYALAAETIKYKDVLESIFSQCSINADTLDVKKGVLLVMSYEILFGSGKIEGGGVVKRVIKEHLPAMKDCLSKMMTGKTDYIELLPKSVMEFASMPKYVRINQAKLSLDEGLEYVQSIQPSAVLDDIVPSLIVLPSSAKSLGQDPYVQSGKLIIQDKASCFPSQILWNQYNAALTKTKKNKHFISGGDFIDACAAPGNKTSHLASLIHANHKRSAATATEMPKVFAYDKSRTRGELLASRMQQAGVNKIVEVQNADFLSIDVNSPTYSRVTSILLDPSCSGSGVIRAIERVHDTTTEENQAEDEDAAASSGRLEKLRNFQIMALRKALTFPEIQRVVYSTCSVHDAENELVVAEVLNNPLNAHLNSGNGKNGGDDVLANVGEDWQLVPPTGFDTWNRRGKPTAGLSEQQSRCLIRCLPEDGTNGFFVAMLERKTHSTARYNHLDVFPVAQTSGKKRHQNDYEDDSEYHSKKAKKGKHLGESGTEGSKTSSGGAGGGGAGQQVIPRSQKPKTNASSNGHGSGGGGVVSGSLFGKRFQVSKSAAKKFRKGSK